MRRTSTPAGWGRRRRTRLRAGGEEVVPNRVASLYRSLVLVASLSPLPSRAKSESERKKPTAMRSLPILSCTDRARAECETKCTANDTTARTALTPAISVRLPFLPFCLFCLLTAPAPPSPASLQLSTRLGNQIMLKREDTTAVFSFKLRGAYNLMKQLTEDERWRGVIACSAGALSVLRAGRSL